MGTSTLLLDQTGWDLVLGSNGNIAVASEPYALAQDAASEIKTFQGEVYWDLTLGVPYMSKVLGRAPSIPLLKATFVDAAKEVQGVAAAECFISSISERQVAGQVQVTSAQTGQVSAVNFAVVNTQGVG